jgi:flagellar biosynthetic protein FliR
MDVTWLELLPLFLLVLVRMTAFFVVAPIFSLRGVPNQFKIGLAFFLALVSMTTIEVNQPIGADAYFIALLLKEVIVGLALGFVAALVLYTVQVAGSFIDFQMGFLIANLVDPQTGAQVPIIGNFKYTLAIIFLLAVNAHHLLIEGVIRSYRLVPVDLLAIQLGSEQIAQLLTYLFVQMFIIAFQIAVPIVGALFLIDVALGIVARTVPQLNVFVVGLPIKILSGFALILLTLSSFFMILQSIIKEMINAMGQLLYLIGG